MPAAEVQALARTLAAKGGVDKAALAWAEAELSHGLRDVDRNAKAGGAAVGAQGGGGNGARCGTPPPGQAVRVLKVAPVIVNALAKCAKADGDRLDVLELCALAVGRIHPNVLKTKSPWTVHKIALNCVKVLRKFQRLAAAAELCGVLCQWLEAALGVVGSDDGGDENLKGDDAIGQAGDAAAGFALVREAVVLRLKLVVTLPPDLEGCLVVCKVAETIAAASRASFDATQIKAFATAVKTALVSAASLVVKMKGTSPATVFALRRAALMVEADRHLVTINRMLADICRAEKKSERRDSTEIVRLCRDLGRSDFSSCSLQAAAFFVHCTWQCFSAGDREATVDFAARVTGAIRPKRRGKTPGCQGDYDFCRGAALALQGLAAIAAPESVVGGAKAVNKLLADSAALLQEHSVRASHGVVTEVMDILVEAIGCTAPNDGGSDDLYVLCEATAGLAEVAFRDDVDLAAAATVRTMQVAATVATLALPAHPPVRRALEWLARACDTATVPTQLDSVYKTARSLFNDLTKAAAAEADLRGLLCDALALACRAAVAADRGSGTRRDRGVISSLFSSLAALRFKSQTHLGAADAAAKSVAYSPIDELRASSTGVAKRMKEFIYYCARACSGDGADWDEAGRLGPINHHLVDSDGLDAANVSALLRLQLKESECLTMPQESAFLQRVIIDELITLTPPDQLPEYADLLVSKARALRELGVVGAATVDGDDAPLQLCRLATKKVKDAMAEEDSRPLTESLARAYTWLGICSVDAGLDYETPLQVACQLWKAALTSDAHEVAETPTHSGRTIDLLHTVASLFGLLGHSESQVLVYSLIEILNDQLRRRDPATVARTVSALAITGHRVQQMGYVSEAATYFERAEGLLVNATCHEFWLYFSQLTLAQGNLPESSAQLERAVTSASTEELSTAKARISSFSAEIQQRHGDHAHAEVLSRDAFKLRMRNDKKARTNATAAAAAAVAACDSDDATESGNAAGVSSRHPHSQWAIMADVFDSLHQMGTINLAQGFHEVACFYLGQGVRFAKEAGLRTVQAQFLLRLADVSCSRRDFEKATDQVKEVDAMLQRRADYDGVHDMSHDEVLLEIQLLRSRANIAVGLEEHGAALEHLTSAERLLRSVTDDTYICTVSNPSQVSTTIVGTPGERRILEAVGQPLLVAKASKAASRGTKRGTASTQAKAARGAAPGSKRHPGLSTLLATTMAMKYWLGFKLGHVPDVGLLSEIEKYLVVSAGAATVHYYLGCIFTEMELTASHKTTQAVKDVVVSPQDYSKMKVSELRSALSALGLPVSGRKADLVERITCATVASSADHVKDVDTDRRQSLHHFKRALELCTDVGDASLLPRLCSRLCQLATGDPWHSCWYSNISVGARARYEHTRRTFRQHPGGPRARFSAGLGSKPRQVLQLGADVTEFRHEVIESLPSDLVAVTVSVDEEHNDIVVSRVTRDCATPVIHRLGSDCAKVVAKACQQVSDIIAQSDIVIASGRDIVSVEDASERAVEMAKWWEKREVLDAELRDVLHTVETKALGMASTLFLGISQDKAYVEKLSIEAQALADEVAAKVSLPVHELKPKCERIIDGLVDGVLQEDALESAASFLIGMRDDDQACRQLIDAPSLRRRVARLRELAKCHGSVSHASPPRAAAAAAAVPFKTPARRRPLATKTPAHPSHRKACPPSTQRKAFARKSRAPVSLVHHDIASPVAQLHFDSPDPKSDGCASPSAEAYRASRHAVCLVLDRKIQSLPFESMPMLQRRPVCRMPTLSLIPSWPSQTIVRDSSTFYVLNPSQDLPATQERFENTFRKRSGWDGTTGEPPAVDRFREKLASRDLFVYCGHGAGQDFFRESALRDTQCRSTALLMGCSSGKLRERGDFEPHGIALEYLYAGAPAVVANLWDITDRDLDGATEHLLQEWRDNDSGSTGLLHAVATARETCRLKYLNGAALVVYGQNVRRKD